MLALRLVPVVLSTLLLAAHFFRRGSYALVLLSLVLPCVLLVRRTWAPRVVQAGLVLGSIEWLRTLVDLARTRAVAGEPWARMAAILAAVALFTAASAALLPAGRWPERRPETRPR